MPKVSNKNSTKPLKRSGAIRKKKGDKKKAPAKSKTTKRPLKSTNTAPKSTVKGIISN